MINCKGDVSQLAENSAHNRKVVGSIPTIATRFPKNVDTGTGFERSAFGESPAAQ